MFNDKFLSFIVKLIISNIKRQRNKIPCLALSRCVQHIFDKNPVTPCWIIHQHMGHSSYQFAVLNNRAAAHALDDAAGAGQEGGVCDFNQEIPAVGAGLGIAF